MMNNMTFHAAIITAIAYKYVCKCVTAGVNCYNNNKCQTLRRKEEKPREKDISDVDKERPEFAHTL